MNNNQTHMKHKQPLIILGLLIATLAMPISLYAGEMCRMPDVEEGNYDIAQIKEDQRRKYYNNSYEEEVNITLTPEEVIHSETDFNLEYLEEESSHLDNYFSETSAELMREGEVITSTVNEALHATMASKILKGIKLVGKTAAEVLGPVGDIVMAAMWTNGVIDAFESESSTAFDKAYSFMAGWVLPLDLIMDTFGLRAFIDNKIIEARANSIHRSSNPFDTTKKYMVDYNQQRLMWAKFADNFYTIFLPQVGREIIEDVVAKHHFRYLTLVKLQDDMLDKAFKKIDFAYHKSIQAALIKKGDQQKIRIHGSLLDDSLCALEFSDDAETINVLVNYAACLRQDVYLKRLAEMKDVAADDEFVAAVTEYVAAKKQAANAAEAAIDKLRTDLPAVINQEVTTEWTQFLNGTFYGDAKQMLQDHYIEAAMHEFADTELNRQPSPEEIANKRILTAPAGYTLENCTNGGRFEPPVCTHTYYSAEYKYFSQAADYRLRNSYDTIQGYIQDANDQINSLLNNYLPQLLSGQALADKSTNWQRVLENINIHFNMHRQAQRNYDSFRSELISKMDRNKYRSDGRSNLWSHGYLRNQGFNVDYDYTISDLIGHGDDLIKFKEFIDDDYRNGIGSRRDYIQLIRHYYSHNGLNFFTMLEEYDAYVTYPFFAPHPLFKSLDQEFPAVYQKLLEVANKGDEISTSELHTYILQVYDETEDHVMLMNQLGSLTNIGVYTNLLSRTANANPTAQIDSLFFSTQLTARHKAWLYLDQEKVTTYLDFFKNRLQNAYNLETGLDYDGGFYTEDHHYMGDYHYMNDANEDDAYMLPLARPVGYDYLEAGLVDNLYKYQQYRRIFTPSYLFDPALAFIPSFKEQLQDLAVVAATSYYALEIAAEETPQTPVVITDETKIKIENGSNDLFTYLNMYQKIIIRFTDTNIRSKFIEVPMEGVAAGTELSFEINGDYKLIILMGELSYELNNGDKMAFIYENEPWPWAVQEASDTDNISPENNSPDEVPVTDEASDTDNISPENNSPDEVPVTDEASDTDNISPENNSPDEVPNNEKSNPLNDALTAMFNAINSLFSSLLNIFGIK